MKVYDHIAIGSGSAYAIVQAILERHPHARVALVEKDEPGAICLNRGCIPSKLLLYPAELVRTIGRSGEFGIGSRITGIDFPAVMQRMRDIIARDREAMREEIRNTPHLDYYPAAAAFTAPYVLDAGDQAIKSRSIFLCTGSKPLVPPIRGLDRIPFLTSDTILSLDHLPESVAVIGGGYIAAEYGHFLAAMGSRVTIIGRNPRFIPEEEPEISALARRDLGKHLTILTGLDIKQAVTGSDGKIGIQAYDNAGKKDVTVTADSVLVATGRGPNTEILHPEAGGIRTDARGWILTNEFLETNQPGIWALGDANGKFMFKHVANYEAKVVYANAVLKQRIPADYRVVPHAVFTDPEIAGVGLSEEEAEQAFGSGALLIGFARYEDTAKGIAMGLKDYFVKVIVERATTKIIGAHIVGPQASVLIQEFVAALSSADQTVGSITDTMHIHPALTEVVRRACGNLMEPEEYHAVAGDYA